jgi:glycosyltransferase involved in cell wall biosynthesis
MVMAGNEEGGLENHFVQLCNAVTEYDVSVIAHAKYRDRFHKNIDFHALDLNKGRRNPLVLWRLYHIIKGISPQIIHTHANKATEMISYIIKFLPKSIKSIASLHSQKRNLKAFYKFDCVIGVSQRVLKTLDHPCKKVIYNGIEQPKPQKVDVRKLFGMDDRFCVCSVGRLEEVKNFSMLIDVCHQADINLIIAGEGSLKDTLQKQIVSLQAENCIKLVGFRNDTIDIIANSDLFVISSLKEGMPYVLIESLLVKTPVVSTDVSDMKHILPQQYVVNVEDDKALLEAILDIKENYQKIQEKYRESFEFAQEHFRFDYMVKSVTSVYNEVREK